MTGGGGKASKPLAGGQRSATTEKPPQKNHPEGWQPPACERCPLGQAGLFPVFFYPQISQVFADWFYQFFICVSLRHLRIYCSVSDRSPVCCVSGRPRLAKRVCGGCLSPCFWPGFWYVFLCSGFSVWRCGAIPLATPATFMEMKLLAGPRVV